ncbi:DUF285 domain-containing protein, partial [Helicobacter felis]
NWNVSRVENMWGMFSGCEDFNQPLNGWNVSKVRNMTYMFKGCEKFNQNLSDWDVSSVHNINDTEMFEDCWDLGYKPRWYKGFVGSDIWE